MTKFCWILDGLDRIMQDNIAYNTIELSNVAPCENVYEIPGTSKMDQKRIEPRVCNSKRRRIQVGCFGLAVVFAITLAALAVVISFVQLASNSSQQQEIQMCKSSVQHLQDKIDILRLEVSAVQNNFSELLLRPSNYEPATTITPTTEPATTITPTTLLSETCGGPGWRRVAFINMTDPNQDCPHGFNLTDYSIRSCGRAHTTSFSCSSAVYPIDGPQYTQVCGRAKAYRWGTSGGFRQTIDYDRAYVVGLSLTHGSPRTHIWTFASGYFSGTSGDGFETVRCPCDPGNTYGPPPFVGNNYFCDSVATVDNRNDVQFFPDNALWDGQDHLNPCYGLNNPPWFNTTLPAPTTDDIELRICLNNGVHNGYSNSNIAVELVEIYVQ